MSRFARVFQSSIGVKVAMAVTGLLLVLFIIAHMLGNLLVFAGPDAMNAYAHKLRQLGALLWTARFVLLTVFLIHIASALRLWRLNRAARPTAYAVSDPMVATYAGRSIVMTGLLVLAFVVYHLLHLTLGVTNPEYLTMLDPQGRRDVYRMIILGFSNVGISVTYLVAMILLGLHLSHGVSSLFQSLGLNHPLYNPFIKRLGPAAAVILVLGFISIPLAVLSGLLQLP